MREIEWFGPVELSVPCHKRMMLVVRMTVAGVASRFGLTLDDMDDLKMAAEEACQSIMLQGCRFETVKLCFDVRENALHVHVSGQGQSPAAENAMQSSLCSMEVMRCILESMVDHVEFLENEQGIYGVELIKNMAPDA